MFMLCRVERKRKKGKFRYLNCLLLSVYFELTWSPRSDALRLNHQHRVFTQLGNGLIHPSIPKPHLQRIADIATGTG